MSKLILHHDPGSPFAGKVCQVLGWKQHAWTTVDRLRAAVS